jgi:hypothetical protein
MSERIGFLPRPAFTPPFPDEIIESLQWAALQVASRLSTARQQRRVPKRSHSLLPGPDTPLWNELVRQIRPHLRRRGRKNHLARLLGVPRQRLYVCLKAKRACFDAERTLLLLAWLHARQHGRAHAAEDSAD